MTKWQKKALEISPTLREDLASGWIDENFNIYDVFFDLLPLCREAHKSGNTKQLAAIYDFAAWCQQQKSEEKELWNAAGVAFYEHLVDEKVTRDAIPIYLTPEVFEDIWPLFEWRLGEEEAAKLRQTFYKYQASIAQEKA